MGSQSRGILGLNAAQSRFHQELQAALSHQRHEYDCTMRKLFATVERLCNNPDLSGEAISESLHWLEVSYDMSHSLLPHPGADCAAGTPAIEITSESTPSIRQESRGLRRSTSRLSLDDCAGEFIMQENEIKHLEFIKESGEVVNPPSTVAILCGPKYSRMKQKLLSPFESFQPKTGRFAEMVDGTGFKLITMFVIVLNFAFIILQSDYKAQHLNKQETPEMVTMGHCFTAFYTLELSILLYVHRKNFFLGPELGWNLFDAGIVAAALVDLLMALVGLEGLNLSFLRVLRFFKISKVLRMFTALRAFNEIRIMIDALVGSASIFVFCCALLAIFLSVFSIFFVQGVTEHLQTLSPDDSFALLLRADWSSVAEVMMQLFMAITGGYDWRDAYNIIAAVGPLQAVLFVFFVLFYQVAFFNVITSVFCEKAMSLATPSAHELIVKRVHKEHHDAMELKALLSRSLGRTAGATIDADQMLNFVHDPEVELYFNVRGLKSSSAHKLYHTLCDVQGVDTVVVGEFISALVQLDGAANCIDAHCLQVRQMHGMHQMRAIQEAQMNEITRLRESIESAQQTSSVEACRPIAAPLEQVPTRLPANTVEMPSLPVINDALKTLKELVRESQHDLAEGQELSKVYGQLSPLCAASGEHSSTSSEPTCCSVSNIFSQNSWKTSETIWDDLLEMKQTLDDIQRSMPVPDKFPAEVHQSIATPFQLPRNQPSLGCGPLVL